MLRNLLVVLVVLVSIVEVGFTGEKSYWDMNYLERSEFLRQKNIANARKLFDPKRGETPQDWKKLQALFNESDNHSLIRNKICSLTSRFEEMGRVILLIEGADTHPEDRIRWTETGQSPTAAKDFYRETGTELGKTTLQFLYLPMDVRKDARFCDLGKRSFALRDGTQMIENLMVVLETINVQPEDIGTTYDRLRQIAHREFHSSINAMRSLLAQSSPRKDLILGTSWLRSFGEEGFIISCFHSVVRNVERWKFSETEKSFTPKERSMLIETASYTPVCQYIKGWDFYLE